MGAIRSSKYRPRVLLNILQNTGCIHNKDLCKMSMALELRNHALILSGDSHQSSRIPSHACANHCSQRGPSVDSGVLLWKALSFPIHHVWAYMLSCVQFFVTLWTVAHLTPLSIGFFRQEYWSGLPFPPPRDRRDTGIEPVTPVSPASQVDSLLLSHQGSLYTITALFCPGSFSL